MEALRLGANYLTEFVRRVFSRWLAAARNSRHRRVVLQEREADMKTIKLSAAWDKWREKFKNERLRPIVSYFTILKMLRR